MASTEAAAGRERPETRSLKATFEAAEQQRRALEQGGGGAGRTCGDAVRAAVEAYETCGRRVAALALFSPNEAVEDMATAHLPYLLVPLRIAELVLRLPTTASDPAARRAVLQRARDAYEQFLHQVDGYGLLTPAYARLLEAYTEDPARFSTVGSVDGSSTAGPSPSPAAGLAGLADPAARRSAKIANFQAEKALRVRLEALRERQQQARRLRRSTRQTQRERQRRRDAVDDDDDDDDDGHNDGHDHGNDGEDEDDDDDDDEEVRKLYLAEVDYGVHMAFQGLDGINVEDRILALAPADPAASSRDAHGILGGLGDNRQRRPGAAAATDDALAGRLDQTHATPGLRRMQGVLGGGAPTWAGAVPSASAPLLTADGRPKQPFTILGSRADIARNVFRPGHNLPTMSIDEYLAEERRRGGIVEGGGPSSGLPPPPDEDNYEKADAETMKARAWDEFTEANPKGAGNTMNRG